MSFGEEVGWTHNNNLVQSSGRMFLIISGLSTPSCKKKLSLDWKQRKSLLHSLLLQVRSCQIWSVLVKRTSSNRYVSTPSFLSNSENHTHRSFLHPNNQTGSLWELSPRTDLTVSSGELKTSRDDV